MKRVFPVLILFLLIFLAYANTWLNAFQFDDITSILKKHLIRDLGKISEFITNPEHRPVVFLTYNINYWISEYRVWSYHFFNILFHMVATVLVYQLTGLALAFRSRDREAGLPFLAAVLFALHPLSTQSVTYISSRSSILATLFYLATMILVFKGIQVRKPAEGLKARSGMLCFAGAGVCLALGFFCKKIVVSIPAMLFLFHYYFVSGESFTAWLKKQGKWIVIAAVLFIGAVGIKLAKDGRILANSAAQTPPATYLLTQTHVIPFEYFKKMLFPINLNVDIDHPDISDWARPGNWKGIAVLAVFVVMLVSISRKREDGERLERAAPGLAGFGMAWMLITLLPTSSVVPLLDVAVEHRTYLPMVGFSIFFAVMILSLLRNLKRRGYAAGVTVCIFGMMAVPLLYAAQVMDRNRVWKNEITLWTDVKQKSPALIRPYNNLGEAYDKLKQYDKAIMEFEVAVKLNPTYYFGLSNLGNIYGKLKQYPKAIEYFKKALQANPNYAPAHYNLAKALHLVKKPQEAIEHYRKAVKFNPNFEEAFYNLASLALQLGRVDEAVENFNTFLYMQPRHAMAHFQLGNAFSMRGRFEEAIAQFQETVELQPDYVFAYVGIANILMQTGKLDNAIRVYEAALTVNPGVAGIHKNLGMIYQQRKNDPVKAAHHYKEYLRLQPNAPDAALVRSTLDAIKKS
jgi:tetratricopeptide (TPR) repeat protein